MAKAKNTVKATSTTEREQGIFEKAGARLGDSEIVRAQKLVLWSALQAGGENDDRENLGRDTMHADATIAATAASIKKNGQINPILVTRHGEWDYLVVDGEKRTQAAKLITTGFDYDGETFPADPDFTVIVRPLYSTIDDSSDIPLDALKLIARTMNLNRSATGVTGPISIGRTAAAMQAADPSLKGEKLINALLNEAGITIDSGTLWRYRFMVTNLPKGMQDQILLAESNPALGIGFSVLNPFLSTKVVQPTEEQWQEFYEKTAYTEQIDGNKKKVQLVERHDLRADVLAAWYGCGFDLVGTDEEPSPFAKWQPDGKKLPKGKAAPKQKTAEQLEAEAKRKEYTWKTFCELTATACANTSATPPVVGAAMQAIIGAIDAMTYKASGEGKTALTVVQEIRTTLLQLLQNPVIDDTAGE